MGNQHASNARVDRVSLVQQCVEHPDNEKLIRRAFASFDSNGDGVLDAQERDAMCALLEPYVHGDFHVVTKFEEFHRLVVSENRARRVGRSGDDKWAFLSKDVLAMIFAMLDDKSLLYAGQVCGHWRRVAVLPSLWKHRDKETLILENLVASARGNCTPEILGTEAHSWKYEYDGNIYNFPHNNGYVVVKMDRKRNLTFDAKAELSNHGHIKLRLSGDLDCFFARRHKLALRIRNARLVIDGDDDYNPTYPVFYPPHSIFKKATPELIVQIVWLKVLETAITAKNGNFNPQYFHRLGYRYDPKTQEYADAY